MQTKHEACNSLLGFQGTSRMRPVEAVPQEHLWNTDMVGKKRAGGSSSSASSCLGVTIGALPHSGRELGSPSKPLQAWLPVTKDLVFPPGSISRFGWVGNEWNSSGYPGVCRGDMGWDAAQSTNPLTNPAPNPMQSLRRDR